MFLADKKQGQGQGGWGVKEALAANPGLTKIVSLIRVHPKELFRGGPTVYRPEEVEALGLGFGQVVCHPVGHIDSTDIPHPFPSEQVVEAFFKEVEHEEGLVAVHCSHGLNRTGYLIIRYLVDRVGVEPEEAIRRFNKARGFPLQRASILHYITSRGWLKQEGQEGGGHSKQERKMAEEQERTQESIRGEE